MGKVENACLLCGAPLVYLDRAEEMRCGLCGKAYPSRARCEKGHFVCDACHGEEGSFAVLEGCLRTGSRDPVAIAKELMADPRIHMHGPEHHVLVASCLLAACKNAGAAMNWPEMLLEAIRRGKEVPGGACGFWGCCGAAISAGIAVSVLTGATPLEGETWGLSNRMTARCLSAIGSLGGPRCCKRDSLTALLTGTDFLREELGIQLDRPEEIRCGFFSRNAQCIGKRCPYFPGKLRSEEGDPPAEGEDK